MQNALYRIERKQLSGFYKPDVTYKSYQYNERGKQSTGYDGY